MIIGKKNNIAAYKGITERLDRAIDYVLSLDSSVAAGKYDIDGKNLYVTVTESVTKPAEGCELEAHKNYLDLQYVISGGEYMGYAPVDSCTPVTEYNAEKDVVFLTGKPAFIPVNAGEFYIVHPFDAHAPGKGFEPTKFKKAVIKIKL